MKQKKQPVFTVRMERLPNRRAIERVREAYQRFYHAAEEVEIEQPIQEAQDEPDGSDLCEGLNLAAGTGSDY